MKISLPAPIKSHTLSKSAAFLGIISALVSLFTFATPTFAIETQTISAFPAHSTDTDPRTKSWFIYDLPDGDKRNDNVVVVNNSNAPVTLKVYAVDSTTTKDGQFALANYDAPKNDLGGWVNLSASEVTLQPKEKKNIPFTIAIPSDAAKGEHSGGIIFENTEPTKMMNRGVHVNVISRIGVRIYETVPGDEQLSMAVHDFKAITSNDHLAFQFTVENNGTVHSAPTGILQVKDMLGRVIDTEPLDQQVGTVVPGQPQTVTIPTRLDTPLLGWNTASLALYYSPTKAVVASATASSNPWANVAALAIILLIIAYFIAKNRLMHTTKAGKVKVAPHIKVIVVALCLGVVALSGFVVFLLDYYFAR